MAAFNIYKTCCSILVWAGNILGDTYITGPLVYLVEETSKRTYHIITHQSTNLCALITPRTQIKLNVKSQSHCANPKSFSTDNLYFSSECRFSPPFTSVSTADWYFWTTSYFSSFFTAEGLCCTFPMTLSSPSPWKSERVPLLSDVSWPRHKNPI